MTFEYIVKPRIPVRGLPAEKTVVKPTVMDLEKEDVLIYLRFGNVYRKFSQDDVIKVERSNLDNLHVPYAEYFKNIPATAQKIDPVNDTIVSNPNVTETELVGTGETTVGEATNKEVPVTDDAVEEKPAKVSVPEIKTEQVEEEKAEEPVVSEPAEVAEEEVKPVEEEIADNATEETAKAEETPVEEKKEEVAAEEPFDNYGEKSTNNQHQGGKKKKH